MPAFAGVTRVIEIKTVGTIAAAGSGIKIINVISHWRRTATVLPVVKSAIDTAYQTAIVVPMFAALNARITQSNNQVRSMDDANDPYLQTNHAVVGSITGDAMATVDAAYLLFRTALRGRSYRGSKHFTPMSESDTTTGTDDIWNAGCLGRLSTIAAAFLAGFTAAAGDLWIPVVLSRRPPSQLSTNPTTVVTNDVTSILVRKSIGSMLHRKAKSLY